VRDADRYFETISAEPNPEAVALAVELIKAQTGPFKPATMPNQFAEGVRELIRAKVEQRAPEITPAASGTSVPAVINIMNALKASVQAKSRTKVREAVAKRSGKAAPKLNPMRRPAPKPSSPRTAN
jgi:DNA end-binding protein Ku